MILLRKREENGEEQRSRIQNGELTQNNNRQRS